MKGDSYSATWVSHSSISDFLACPRAYYLKHVYKDKKTRHKIKIVSPPLSLGQAVHEVLESIANLPTEDRFNESLILKLDRVWSKISGKRGGFVNDEVEMKYKKRAEEMLNRVMKHPGPISQKAVKIKSDKQGLIYYWISEKDNIILCGKIDWLEYIQVFDSVHIIDFKTNKGEERAESLQLPIYYLLTSNTQKRKVDKVSYWYLERSDELAEQPLPEAESSYEKILEIAKKIKLARQLSVFKCPHKTGCMYCKPYEAILRNEGEFVGIDEYGTDVFILSSVINEKASVIL
ncbi:MAG: PD-(D/E)XK nuclease family protein [bacterium]|nr:PD-(D/E)XK nuclease family protein [bacterium]